MTRPQKRYSAKFLQGAVAGDRRLHLQQRAEHDGVHEQRRRRVDEGPGPPEHAALVARLQLALREVPDESSVAPELGCCCHTWRKLALRPAACPEGSRPRYAVRPVPGGTSAPGPTRLGRPSRLRRPRGLRRLRRRYGGSRFHGAHEPGRPLARAARPGDAGRHRARSASRLRPMLRTRDRVRSRATGGDPPTMPSTPHRARDIGPAGRRSYVDLRRTNPNSIPAGPSSAAMTASTKLPRMPELADRVLQHFDELLLVPAVHMDRLHAIPVVATRAFVGSAAANDRGEPVRIGEAQELVDVVLTDGSARVPRACARASRSSSEAGPHRT